MKIISAFALCLICIQIYACNNSAEIEQTNNSDNLSNTDSMKLKIKIGTHTFIATLFTNATAVAFKAKLPMTINMTELNGNEKFFELTDNLPVNASKPGTVKAGDLMLFGSNTIVLFYKTFSTSYSYTPFGSIDNPSGLAAALGSGNLTVLFELE
ncbi:MAG TPA: cyclophilin-like fold protein [Ignavibacteriaceae bacterium]